MTLVSTFRHASFLVRSNFGRASGWIVELDGSPLGQLTDCVNADMFWDSYSIVPIQRTDTSRLYDDELWNGCKFRFKNQVSSEYVSDAFCGGAPPFVRGGRILMRRLYLSPKTSSESLLIAVLSKLARVRGRRG